MPVGPDMERDFRAWFSLQSANVEGVVTAIGYSEPCAQLADKRLNCLGLSRLGGNGLVVGQVFTQNGLLIGQIVAGYPPVLRPGRLVRIAH